MKYIKRRINSLHNINKSLRRLQRESYSLKRKAELEHQIELNLDIIRILEGK